MMQPSFYYIMRLLVLAYHIRMCPDSVADNYIYDLKLSLLLPIPSISIKLANYTLRHIS